MPSTSSARFAAVALVSIVSLIALSSEAAAAKSRKISHSTPTAAAMSGVAQNSNPGTYSYGLVTGGSIHQTGRGVVLDNTAGWGNVGAF